MLLVQMREWKRIDHTGRDTREETEKVRLAQIRRLTEEIAAAQSAEADFDMKRIRGELDRDLFFWHEDGMSIQSLADAAGITRDSAYEAVDRYRAILRGLPH
jgi:hypothetical protein